MENSNTFIALVKFISAVNKEGRIEELLTDDFVRKSKEFLNVRRAIVDYRWYSFIDTCYKKMLSSHEMYLTFIMYACIGEKKGNENIFDSFIDVYSVIKNLISDTYRKLGVDFVPLLPDIFYLFYQAELQDDFCKNGGTRRLVEYIRNHRLVRGKRKKNNRSTHHPARDSFTYRRDLQNKFAEESSKDRLIEIVTSPEEVENHEESCALAKGVLSIASPVKLPTLPSFADMVKSLVAYRKRDAKEIAGAKKTESSAKPEALNIDLKGCSSSISDSKNDDNEENQDNIEWYENIIQAVIRHNQSKGTANADTKDRILEEVDVVLEQLIDTLKSLVEILEEQKVVAIENK